MLKYAINLYKQIKGYIPVKTKRRIKKELHPSYKLIVFVGYSFVYICCQMLGFLGLFFLKIKIYLKSQKLTYPIRKENRKKVIGIDMRPLQMIGSRSRGIGFYTKHLIDELLSFDNKTYNFLLYALNDTAFDDSFKSPNLNYILKRRSQRLMWLWNTTYLPSKLLDGGVSLFHATDPFCIVKPTQFYRTIATVYDVIPLIFPKYYLLPTTLYRRYAYTNSYAAIHFVNAVITISEHAKRDVAKFLKIPLEKIYVTHLAADKRFKPIMNDKIIKRTKNKYQIHNDYILYVGGIDYRKNVISLLKAFATILPHFKNLSLIIVGNDIFNPLEPMKKKVHQTIHNLHLHNRIILLGFIPTEDLIILFSGARLFVYPSLYEGFGLPVLEAMACGCPVVCSNTSSLPEVAGNAAIFIKPNDVNQIGKAIKTVLENNDVSNKLRILGLQQAKKFSWKNTAEKTIKVYEEIYSHNFS